MRGFQEDVGSPSRTETIEGFCALAPVSPGNLTDPVPASRDAVVSPSKRLFCTPRPTQLWDAERAIERWGRHVVAYVGFDKPWRSFGQVAIQLFRPAQSAVYFIGGDEGAIKIGVSIAPLERLATMQMGCPIPLRILALVDGGTALEREYHQRFAEAHSHGEWFHRSPEILAEIARLNEERV